MPHLPYADAMQCQKQAMVFLYCQDQLKSVRHGRSAAVFSCPYKKTLPLLRPQLPPSMFSPLFLLIRSDSYVGGKIPPPCIVVCCYDSIEWRRAQGLNHSSSSSSSHTAILIFPYSPPPAHPRPSPLLSQVCFPGPGSSTNPLPLHRTKG